MNAELDPGLIYDLYTGVFRPQIVRLALQLDLFKSLAHGPTDAATVARACQCSEAGITQLLDVLVGVKVLTQEQGRYALTPSAAAFLARDRPAYAGDLILAWTGPAIWESEWTQITSLLLWVNGGGATHSFERYRAWLTEAGFGQVSQVSERRLAASKASGAG